MQFTPTRSRWLSTVGSFSGGRVRVLNADARLWTRDKRLRIAAHDLGCAFQDATTAH